MMLSERQLDELNGKIYECEEKLETLRKSKIRHYVQKMIFNKFGCLLENVGIVMDNNGVKYVLSNLDDQIEYNYDNQRYCGYSVRIIAKTIVKTNGTLSKTNRIMYDLTDLTRTGERYYG